MFMNEYDIQEIGQIGYLTQNPNLIKAHRTLANLADWADRVSDGWTYWLQPRHAARSLMGLLETWRTGYYAGHREDLDAAQLKRALVPIKSFLTRQGVAHDEIIPD